MRLLPLSSHDHRRAPPPRFGGQDRNRDRAGPRLLENVFWNWRRIGCALANKRPDKVARKKMFYAFPMFWLLDTKDPLTITLAIIAVITFGQMIGFGVGAPWYSELFSARLRYSGASLGFRIGAAISGGLTPFAAATFTAWTGGATA